MGLSGREARLRDRGTYYNSGTALGSGLVAGVARGLVVGLSLGSLFGGVGILAGCLSERCAGVSPRGCWRKVGVSIGKGRDLRVSYPDYTQKRALVSTYNR